MVPVNLVRTYQQNIDDANTLQDGYLYVAKDTGRVFLDFNDERIELGTFTPGPGIAKWGNQISADVVDIVDPNGNSIVDSNGVAHVGHSGSSDIDYATSSITAGYTSGSTTLYGKAIILSVIASEVVGHNPDTYRSVLVDWEAVYNSSTDQTELTTSISSAISNTIEIGIVFLIDNTSTTINA